MPTTLDFRPIWCDADSIEGNKLPRTVLSTGESELQRWTSRFASTKTVGLWLSHMSYTHENRSGEWCVSQLGVIWVKHSPPCGVWRERWREETEAFLQYCSILDVYHNPLSSLETGASLPWCLSGCWVVHSYSYVLRIELGKVAVVTRWKTGIYGRKHKCG